jgi:hypothetical protein
MPPVTYLLRMVAKEGKADNVLELLLVNPRRITPSATQLGCAQIGASYASRLGRTGARYRLLASGVQPSPMGGSVL